MFTNSNKNRVATENLSIGLSMLSSLRLCFNTEGKRKLISNFLSLSVLQAFTYVLPLVTLPYLVRVLGVEKYGLVMFAHSFVMFFNIIVDYGFNLSATREISIHRDNKERITEIFCSVMALKFIMTLFSLGVLTVVIFSNNRFIGEWRLYYLTFLWVIGQALFPVWYFQGLEQMKYITIVNIASKSLFTLLIFIFVQEKKDYILVPLLNGVGVVSGGLIALYIVLLKFKQPVHYKSIQLTKHFYNGFHIFLSIFSSSLMSIAPVLFIGYLIDYQMTGFYSAFDKMVVAIKNLFFIINQTFFPRISKIYSENKARFSTIWKRLTCFTFGTAIITYVLVFMSSNKLILFFLGSNFLEYSYLFNILLISVVSYVIMNSLGLNGLLVIGQSKLLSKSQIPPVLFFILLSPYLLLHHGIAAYLFAILITDLLIISVRIFFLKRLHFFG